MYRVLFVDDEESILKITEILLSSLGIEVILANSGKQAIKILSDEKPEKKIHIIFLDLTMPEMSGLEVFQWINSNKITIPVILQTGIADKSELNQALKLGVKECLIKPYTKKQLYELIKKHAKLV
jgi:CheY-like chemotaxis protein